MSAHFQQVQRVFCDWIRQPEQQSLPDQVALSRMQVYRELLFNNVCEFVDRVYPVAQSLLPAQTWQQLKADFFSFGRCESPFYLDISLHFRDYLVEVEHPVLQDYPWLTELLQVEWLELHLDLVAFTWPDPTQLATELFNEPLTQLIQPPPSAQLTLSAPIWVLAYQWPVYQWQVGDVIGADLAPAPSVVVAWRDQRDQVRVEPLQPIAAVLLEWIQHVGVVDWLRLGQQLEAVLPQLTVVQVEEWLQQVGLWLQQRGLLRCIDPA